MAQQEMTTKRQQLKLPWQIEWIWHVHRLHPLVYEKDCKQLPDGKLVDKMVYNMIKNRNKKHDSKIVFKSIKSRLSFIPSIDLVQAVVRQRDFLEKFKQHRLYSWNFKQVNRSYFEDLAENYVLFMRLARKKEMIVPTFDIDLIWHSHMRYPSHYQKCSIALCGFILDHDDSIEHDTLSDNYQKTADRWKTTYNTDYDKKSNRKNSSSGLVGSGCGSICGGGDGGAGCGGGGDGGGCGGGGSGGGCGGGGGGS